MPAPKRRCAKAPQGPPASKRRGGVTGAPKTRAIRILKDCAKEQQKHIAGLNKFLVSQEPRFQRLRLHVQYQLKVEKMRLLVRNLTEEQIKEHEKKISGYNGQEMIAKISVEEMERQEEKLEKIAEDVIKYKGYRLQDAEKIVLPHPERHPYEPFDQELKDALLNIPSTFRDDAEMESVPELQKKDLEVIKWPEVTYDWNQHAIHWDSESEEAAECQKRNEEIRRLKKKLVEVQSVYREAQTRKDRIKLYDENRKCPIQNKKIRDFERTVYSVQLEQVIQKSFERKASRETLKAKERVLEVSRKPREDLLKSIQEDVNSELLKCSVCFEALTNGEQSVHCPQLFGSCGHTVCATCMTQFKARESPYHWTCHQCRKPSDKVLTNWALMQLIKETPGQPQRVVVEAPQAVPIVPAPWRLERRHEADENPFRARMMNNDNFDRMMLHFLDDLDNRHVNRAPEAPVPVPLVPEGHRGPRAWAPMNPQRLVPPAPVIRQGALARDPGQLAPLPRALVPEAEARAALAPDAPAPVPLNPEVYRGPRAWAPMNPQRLVRAPLPPAPVIGQGAPARDPGQLAPFPGALVPEAEARVALAPEAPAPVPLNPEAHRRPREEANMMPRRLVRALLHVGREIRQGAPARDPDQLAPPREMAPEAAPAVGAPPADRAPVVRRRPRIYPTLRQEVPPRAPHRLAHNSRRLRFH